MIFCNDMICLWQARSVNPFLQTATHIASNMTSLIADCACAKVVRTYSMLYCESGKKLPRQYFLLELCLFEIHTQLSVNNKGSVFLKLSYTTKCRLFKVTERLILKIKKIKTYTYSINTLNGLYIQNNWNFNGLKK